MIPALPAGMTPEQLTAALTQMFQAGMAGGAGVPGMAAMVPGAHAGPAARQLPCSQRWKWLAAAAPSF